MDLTAPSISTCISPMHITCTRSQTGLRIPPPPPPPTVFPAHKFPCSLWLLWPDVLEGAVSPLFFLSNAHAAPTGCVHCLPVVSTVHRLAMVGPGLSRLPAIVCLQGPRGLGFSVPSCSTPSFLSSLSPLYHAAFLPSLLTFSSSNLSHFSPSFHLFLDCLYSPNLKTQTKMQTLEDQCFALKQ